MRWRIDWTARPGRRSVLALVFTVAAIYACEESVITGPSGGGGPPPPTTSVPPVNIVPPRVDAPFDWGVYHGFTAFASGEPSQSEQDVRLLFGEAMANGWNTARKCSETQFWSGPGFPTMPMDIERLKWWLDIVATIPGAQVLLIGDCTNKGPLPESEGRDWARAVGKLAAGYANVAIETHNEFKNCKHRGWGPHCPTKSDVAEHIRIYKNMGVEYVTVDEGVCKDDLEKGRLGFGLFGLGAWPADFHPCREYPFGSGVPWDPNKRFLRELVDRNGMILLSETVAWTDNSGRCSGLRTCDEDRIQRYIDTCAEVDDENGGAGCKFTYHSQDLLAGLPPTWWPRAR